MEKLNAPWLTHPDTQRIFALLGDAGHQAFAVGGCVRNALLGVPVKDIDISTSARPEIVMQLAKEAGIKAVPTGIDHGTVTLVLSDEPFEITTFRRDVATDGRRAVVAFSEHLEEDALRRDFTMNALYVDGSGEISDPVGGLPDLQTRRFRFIENADRRIKEDYLRSLRFFRFQAWYGDPDSGMDQDALDGIARNIDGLETLSKERVGAEVLRLLEAPDPAPAVATMRATGVLAAILPGATDGALAPLVHLERENGVAPDAIRRLTALGGEDVVKALRLSRVEAEALRKLRAADAMLTPAEQGYRLGKKLGESVVLIHAATIGQPLDASVLEQVAIGSTHVFPVNAADLMPQFEGKALGDRLRQLEDHWVRNNFTLDREDLLRL